MVQQEIDVFFVWNILKHIFWISLNSEKGDFFFIVLFVCLKMEFLAHKPLPFYDRDNDDELMAYSVYLICQV